MKHRRKCQLSLLLVVLLTAGLFYGCGKGSGEKQNGTEDGSVNYQPDLGRVENELTMKLTGEKDTGRTLTTLVTADATVAFCGNIFDESTGIDWSLQPILFDYLAFYTPLPQSSYRLSMLESYTYENGVLSLKLRPDLKWSDGSVLNAEDVLVNFYCNVGRSTMWYYIKDIEKTDDLSLKVTFVNESPLLLTLVFNQPIRTTDEAFGEYAKRYQAVAETMREYNEETGRYGYTDKGNETITEINTEILAEKPTPDQVISSGPYVISMYNTAEIIFAKNEDYRYEVPFSLRGLRTGDAQALAAARMSGEWSWENAGINVDVQAELDSMFEKTMRKIYIPEMSQIGYTFNTQVYPLDKVEVRQAISMAVDRNSLLAVSEPGSFDGNKYNAGLLPSMMNTYADDSFLGTLTSYDYNPDAAAALLESIGWKKVNGMWVDEKGESPVISIGTRSAWPTFMMTGEAMSEMLKDFGFNIDFRPMESGVYTEYANSDEWMMVCTFVGGASSYAHPWECFNDLFNTNSRTGWQKFGEGEDKIFTTADGTAYNTTLMLQELFTSDDPARITELTRQFITLANDLCGYISVVEKYAPLRVYDPTLSLPEAETNSIQSSPLYYGNLNTMLLKMIQDGSMYFIKK